jgi:hypothetical protein
LSQNRLSELERGAGSFSAEQLLLLMRLFNVTASSFVDEQPDPTLALQNALARFGATHLHEAAHVVPDEDPVGRVVQDALVDGTPRVVTAAAPVLVRHAYMANLRAVQGELSRRGYERRLPWAVDNILAAVSLLPKRLPRELLRNTAALQFASTHFLGLGTSLSAPDILDPTVRSTKTATSCGGGSLRYHSGGASSPR